MRFSPRRRPRSDEEEGRPEKKRSYSPKPKSDEYAPNLPLEQKPLEDFRKSGESPSDKNAHLQELYDIFSQASEENQERILDIARQVSQEVVQGLEALGNGS